METQNPSTMCHAVFLHIYTMFLTLWWCYRHSDDGEKNVVHANSTPIHCNIAWCAAEQSADISQESNFSMTKTSPHTRTYTQHTEDWKLHRNVPVRRVCVPLCNLHASASAFFLIYFSFWYLRTAFYTQHIWQCQFSCIRMCGGFWADNGRETQSDNMCCTSCNHRIVRVV